MTASGLRVLISAVLIVAVGCSSSSGDAPDDQARVEATVERYFTAAQDGDFEAAMSERCSGARIDADRSALFVQQATDLMSMGGLTEVRVTEATDVQLTPSQHASDPIPFDYALVGSAGQSEWLHGVAIVEDGDVRWCGYAPANIDKTTEALTNPVPQGPSPSDDLQSLMPAAGPGGAEQFEDRAVSQTGDASPGWAAAWTRAWARPTYGGTRTTATRYETSDLARSALQHDIQRLAADVTETFQIDGVPNAIGMRHAASAWTWIQPADVGYQCDRALVLAGNTVIENSSCGLLPTETHADVVDLTTALGTA